MIECWFFEGSYFLLIFCVILFLFFLCFFSCVIFPKIKLFLVCVCLATSFVFYCLFLALLFVFKRINYPVLKLG